MKTYLITGGAGFIGSNFINYILERYKNSIAIVNLDKLTYAADLSNITEAADNANYYFIQGDICNRELVDNIFKTYDIDYVVNFAAESHVDRSIINPDIFLKSNVFGTQVLIDCAREHWEVEEDRYVHGKKFLQISTDEVYGTLDDRGYFTEETPLRPRSPYSASKASADMLVQSYKYTYNMPINITRCSNNYGPNQFPEKLIPLAIKKAINGEEIPIYGDGKHIRDWLYVRDHCVAIDMVLRKGEVGEIYNIGGNNEQENINCIKNIIGILKKIFPENTYINENLITYVKDRRGHDRRYGIDFSKIKNELGWYPKVRFDEGIISTIHNVYKKNKVN